MGFDSNLSALWFQALTVFETTAVVGPVAQTGGANIPGLGPSFNGTSCFQCHSQPAVGGSSPNTMTPGFPNGNPQVGDAPTAAQLQAVSSFITANGPVREVRFPRVVAANAKAKTDEVLDGAVANLFVIAGRSDAPASCVIGQEPFQTQLSNNNVIFRIPIPVFGEGFVENTDDKELQTNAGIEKTAAVNLAINGINGTGQARDDSLRFRGWASMD